MASAGFLSASGPYILTFEGLLDGEAISNFYNGGTGSFGSPGFNYGVFFAGQSVALIDVDAGGSGNFENAPSPQTILYFPSEEASLMNVAGGFTDGFSFFYASSEAAFVTIYDGFGGTGTVLNTLQLPATPVNTNNPGGYFDTWSAIGLSFEGTARSVVFSGVANRAGFDNITFGAAKPIVTPVPEPGTYAAVAFVAAAAGATWWRRRRAK